MENNEQKFGVLLTPDMKIHRRYFQEMVNPYEIFKIL